MPRRNSLPEVELGICRRVREFRESLRLSRIVFAFEVQIDSEVLSRIENLRAPLRVGLFYRIASRFVISPKWLATGEGPRSFAVELQNLKDLQDLPDSLFSGFYEKHLKSLADAAVEQAVRMDAKADPWGTKDFAGTPRGRLNALRALENDLRHWLSSIPDANLNSFVGAFRKAAGEVVLALSSGGVAEVMRRYEILEKLADEAVFKGDIFRSGRERLSYVVAPNPSQSFGPLKGLELTDVTLFGNTPAVKPTWSAFIQRLNVATAERGLKSRLAKHMGVKLPNVSQWLSGEREPGGETTLRLLQWVEQQERQQTKGPGSASTPPGPKTRSTKSANENVKSSPPKR